MKPLSVNQVWQDIPDYEGLYQVSNTGLVKSKARICIHKTGRKQRVTEKILKNSTKKSSAYHVVLLSKGGVATGFKVSRLVAKAFIPNPNNYKIVNHIDGNKGNNNIENLEWCTATWNNIHAFEVLKRDRKQTQTIKSEHLGIVWDKNRFKWQASLSRNSKDYFVGRFETEEQAFVAREKFKKSFEYAQN